MSDSESRCIKRRKTDISTRQLYNLASEECKNILQELRMHRELCTTSKIHPGSSQTEQIATVPVSNESDSEVIALLKEVLRRQSINHLEMLQNFEELSQRMKGLENVFNKPHNNPDYSMSLADELEKTLPVKNETQLREFEEELQNDEFFSTAILVAKRVGGDDVRRSAAGVMKKLLSDNMAQEFSMCGFKRKRIFKKLKMWSLVKRTIRKLHPNVGDDEIKKQVGSWLAQAKTRQTRRQMKMDENAMFKIEDVNVFSDMEE